MQIAIVIASVSRSSYVCFVANLLSINHNQYKLIWKQVFNSEDGIDCHETLPNPQRLIERRRIKSRQTLFNNQME